MLVHLFKAPLILEVTYEVTYTISRCIMPHFHFELILIILRLRVLKYKKNQTNRQKKKKKKKNQTDLHNWIGK